MIIMSMADFLGYSMAVSEFIDKMGIPADRIADYEVRFEGVTKLPDGLSYHVSLLDRTMEWSVPMA
uniref:Uncharacterized protein n=1 Tax=uncultured prokaryote TaxID=198431 RepID=A0A0H5PZG2_9ZZZZ|nr:hypothetical protein [uncultured prokaryote]